MVKATLFAFFLLLIVLYVPFLEPIFDTFELGVMDWIAVAVFSIIPLIAGELYKIIVYRDK